MNVKLRNHLFLPPRNRRPNHLGDIHRKASVYMDVSLGALHRNIIKYFSSIFSCLNIFKCIIYKELLQVGNWCKSKFTVPREI